VNHNFPANTPFLDFRTRLHAILLAVALAALLTAPAATFAVPQSPPHGADATTAQNVDYIGAETGAALALDFPVLVPGWVPAPFGGPPSIDAGGGYYSLYWMNGAAEPTFLQVSGQVGGALPAGSPYDLNVQLFVNASVQGYGAIHDVTPIYDAVWWIADGVLYSVESRNSGTDSLTLANSLIAFVPPAPAEPEPEPPVEPDPTIPSVEPEPDPPVSEPETGTGGSTTLPESNPADTNQEAAEDVPGSESTLETESLEDDGSSPDTSEVNPGTESNASAEPPEVVPLGTDGTGDPSVASDGTGGPDMPVIGGDGTGGTNVVTIPPGASPESP